MLQLLGVLSAREITEPFKKIKTRINDLNKMGCINGCIVISNLVISLVPYTFEFYPHLIVTQVSQFTLITFFKKAGLTK
jgi:hypothetical protein